MSDDWNNRASAESWLYDAYPEAEQSFVDKADKIRELNDEWKRCKDGIG